MKILRHKLLLLIITMLFYTSCDKENTNNEAPTQIELTNNVEVYNADLLDNSMAFTSVNGGDSAFLLNKAGEKVYEWTFNDNLGNDLELLPNGKLLGIFKSADAAITFGGYGGKIKIINPDGSVDWDWEYSSPDYILHHDVEQLPNGNILALAWIKLDETAAEAVGSVYGETIYPEKLLEINPNTNTVVWEWNSWDHAIQDTDASFANFGVVSEHPERININYNPVTNGDIMHANGIDYDANRDVIFLSVNFYDEIWVIDHSTTTEEAALSTGGNYNKGGDLLYRLGNPLTYDNTFGEKRFDANHFPNLIEDGEPGEGNMLVYVNGKSTEQSKVLELAIPQNFNLQANTDNEPEVVWSFEDTDMYMRIVSGAVRLDNGNTLICEGDYGFWEVSPNGEVVWKYNGDDEAYWRVYDYKLTDDAIINLGL